MHACIFAGYNLGAVTIVAFSNFVRLILHWLVEEDITVRFTQLTKPSPTIAHKMLRGLLTMHRLSLATKYKLIWLNLLDHLHQRSLMKYWLSYTTRKRKYCH